MGTHPAMNERRVATGILGAAGLIAVMTMLARLAGFGRIVVFADAVRAGGVGGIYQSVNALPNVVYEVAAGGVLAAIAVPLIGRHLGAGDRDRADGLASGLLTWCLIVLLPLGALLALAAGPLTQIFVEGSDPRSHEVAARMLRIFAVQVPLYGIGIVLTGVLQAHRRFLAAALAPLLSSLVVLATYLWYGRITGGQTDPAQVSDGAINLLAWGTTLGVVALSLPLFGPALRAGWRWRPTLHLHPQDRRRIAALAGGGLLALLAQQGAVLVTIWLANHGGGDGAFPVYQYLQAVYLLPYAVLAVPIATSVFPALAQGIGAGRNDALTLSRALRGIVLLTSLAVAALMAAAPAVGGFFRLIDARRGADGASTLALDALPAALFAYAPGLVGFAVAALLTRALYVQGSPTQAGAAVAAGWLVAAVVPLVVVSPGDGPSTTLYTLGLGSTLGMTVSAGLLGYMVRHTWGADALEGVGRSAAVGVVAIALGLAAGSGVVNGWSTDTWLSAIGTGVVAGLVAVMAGLLTLSLGDRKTFRAVLARGRATRSARKGAREGASEAARKDDEP